MNRTATTSTIVLVLALTIAGCSPAETIDIEAAQEQFCSDLSDHIDSLGAYGGLFEDVELTVGDIKNASDELAPGRDAVIASAEVFQEALSADTTPGVEVDIVDPASIERVEEAEEAFADASDIDDNTPVAEAGVRFTSAAYQLEVAWVLLFADAGCIEDEAQATQWVSDYVSALQTDLRAAGYYSGDIDGIYGPDTIAAVEQLQTDAGLPVTGLLDPATQTALAAALGQRESAQVGALQGILISGGYYDGEVDGIWSTEVEEALKALQTDLGVEPTGVVDAATLRAFEEALAGSDQPPATIPPPEPTPTTAPPGPPATTAPAPDTTTTAGTPDTTIPASVGVLDVLEEAGIFTQLLTAIDAAGLTEILSGPGPFTLFAPTDEAILANPLPTDPAALEAALLYHVVEDDLDGFELAALETVTTAQGTDIDITLDQGLIVLNGSSTVTVANVIGGNGVAHVINVPLAPPA